MRIIFNRPAGPEVAVVTLPQEVIQRQEPQEVIQRQDLLPRLFQNAPIEAALFTSYNYFS